MRSPSHLICAAALLLTAACGDDDNKPDAPADTGVPSDAPVRDAGRDAALPLDATVVTARDGSAPVGEDAAEPADGGLDATLEQDAAVADATVDTTDASVTISEPDAATEPDAAAEPDAGGDVPDAEVPPPVCDPSVAPVVGKLGLQTVVSGYGLGYLTEAHQPPNSNDWYLVQQDGYIKILRDGVLLPEPFLDLHSEINLMNDAIYEDRGLVSIEFAPDYASSGRFYVSVTANRGARTNLDDLRAYSRSAENPDVADPAIKEIVLSVAGNHIFALPTDVTTNIHNGGRVTFGPDGMLYLAMGDGGGINCGDSEPGATQDIGSLFGKLIRLDLSQPPPYAALDNPFVVGGDPRVLHYGLRNPFRYSFDRLTGDLYLGDVGQNSFEELDFAPAGSKGLNFGWAHFEGYSEDTCGGLRALRPGSVHTPPIFVADRRVGAINVYADYSAMIGGVVYRGAALPQLQGIYFAGDFRGDRMVALRHCGGSTSPVTPVAKQCNANSPNEACFGAAAGAKQFIEMRAIVEDHDGEMFIVANRDTLFKVVPR
jgi:glucose/arabinose dehydrogenase